MGDSAIQHGHFVSTDLFEQDLRNEIWREITRPIFDTTLHDSDGKTTLEGSLRSQPVGSLLIGPTTFNKQRYKRDRRIIVQSGLDHYLLQLFIAGSLKGDCDGYAISVGPGDICIFDLARPFASDVSPGSTISVMLPREELDKAAGGRSLHGKVLQSGIAITRLLADFILSLSNVATEMDSSTAVAVEESMLHLLAAGIARDKFDRTSGDSALAQVLRRSVLDFINANLFDRNLSPAFLMQRFRISRAHLYRMFATDGGVAKVVRNKRLDATYRRLARGDAPISSLTETAFNLGFSSSSQFSRAFRARFSVTPSEIRREAASRSLQDLRLSDLQAYFARHSTSHHITGREGKTTRSTNG